MKIGTTLGKIFKPKATEDNDLPYEGDVLGRLVHCLKPVHAQLPSLNNDALLLQEQTRKALLNEATAMVNERIIRRPDDLHVSCSIEPAHIFVEAKNVFTGGYATRSWIANEKRQNSTK